MKVVQWNVQWCRGLDGIVDPRRVVSCARLLGDFDVLCLQEVAIHFPALAGSDGEDQVEVLSALLPGYEPIFAAAVDTRGRDARRQRFGNMIFSRYPVVQVFRHSLPWPAQADTPSMPRVALEAIVEAPFGHVRVTTTHLEYYSDIQRAAQVDRLRDLHAEACGRALARPSTQYRSGPFESLPRPVSSLLCGDFNLPGGADDPLYARMHTPVAPGVPRYVDAWSILRPGKSPPPTFCVHEQLFGPARCCDFVFVSDDLAARLMDIRIDGETRASDHQPVYVEIG